MKERKEEGNNKSYGEIQENFNEDDQMEMNEENSSEELSELKDELLLAKIYYSES